MKRFAANCIALLGALCLAGFVIPPPTSYRRPRTVIESPR